MALSALLGQYEPSEQCSQQVLRPKTEEACGRGSVMAQGLSVQRTHAEGAFALPRAHPSPRPPPVRKHDPEVTGEGWLQDVQMRRAPLEGAPFL